MVPTGSYVFYLHSVSKNFDWLLSMHIHRITYSELAVLIKTNREYPTLLSQKYTVKLAACRFLNVLTVKIWLGRFYSAIMNLLNFYCP